MDKIDRGLAITLSCYFVPPSLLVVGATYIEPLLGVSFAFAMLFAILLVW